MRTLCVVLACLWRAEVRVEEGVEEECEGEMLGIDWGRLPSEPSF